MTRFLKLVRHEDGKWKALPTETDDLTQVSLKERQYAPIDPDQLLKALDSLLSKNGGIKSVEDVPRLARCLHLSWNKFASCHHVKPSQFVINFGLEGNRVLLAKSTKNVVALWFWVKSTF